MMIKNHQLVDVFLKITISVKTLILFDAQLNIFTAHRASLVHFESLAFRQSLDQNSAYWITWTQFSKKHQSGFTDRAQQDQDVELLSIFDFAMFMAPSTWRNYDFAVKFEIKLIEFVRLYHLINDFSNLSHSVDLEAIQEGS